MQRVLEEHQWGGAWGHGRDEAGWRWRGAVSRRRRASERHIKWRHNTWNNDDPPPSRFVASGSRRVERDSYIVWCGQTHYEIVAALQALQDYSSAARRWFAVCIMNPGAVVYSSRNRIFSFTVGELNRTSARTAIKLTQLYRPHHGWHDVLA